MDYTRLNGNRGEKYKENSWATFTCEFPWCNTPKRLIKVEFSKIVNVGM